MMSRHNEHDQAQGIKPQNQKRKVVSEEEYTSTLSSIISRDYYPALPSLHRDAAILDRRSEGDISGAVAIRRAARTIALHEESLAEQESKEEADAIVNHGGVRVCPRPLHRESVDGFHARVTSEDNADFEKNMREEERAKKERLGIIYNTSGSRAKDLPLMLENNKGVDVTGDGSKRVLDDTPLMASDHFTAPVQRIHVAGTTKDGKSLSERNSLFFTPPHNNEQSNSAIVPFASKAASHNDESMPPPPSRNKIVKRKEEKRNDENSIIQSQLNAAVHYDMMQLVEYTAKNSSSNNSKEKQVIPKNTRFHYQNESRLISSSSNDNHQLVSSKQNNMDRSITASAYDTDSTLGTDLDASPLSLNLERAARAEKIKKNRNTLVAMTPLIVPGQGGSRNNDIFGGSCYEEEESPIVTWGDVASTPLVVGQHAIQSNFDDSDDDLKIHHQEPSVRNESQSKTKRKRREVTVSSSSVLDRSKSLTPAAQLLLEKCTNKNKNNSVLRITSAKASSSKINARSSSAFGSTLRMSYSRNSSQSRSKRRDTTQKTTPMTTPRRLKRRMPGQEKVSQIVGQKPSDNITGGLLQLE